MAKKLTCFFVFITILCSLCGLSVSAQMTTLTVGTMRLSVDTVIISGSVSGGQRRSLVISMTDENGDLYHIEPIYTNEDGSFSHQFNFKPGSTGGYYTVIISGRMIENSYTNKFYYTDPGQEQVICDAFNKAESVSATKELIAAYKPALGLESMELSATELEDLGNVFYEQKPYTCFADFTKLVDTIQAIVTAINESDWSQMQDVISQYEKVLMHQNANYSYYKTLSLDAKKSLNKILVDYKPFAGLVDFRKDFASSADKYKSSVSKPGKGSSGGSGSSGGRDRVVTITASDNQIPKTDDKDTLQTPIFVDLDQAEWAKSSIETLFAKKIIAADAEKRFRPQDNVTRAEFIKLLMESLGKTNPAAVCGFNDVSKDVWYYSYVGSAQELGIAKGREDGSFGADEWITRQEMSVMMYRGVIACSIALQEKMPETHFSDDEQISDYAKEAIYFMQKAGVISGMGDGCFAPKGFATRAESAKILCNVLEGLKA